MIGASKTLLTPTSRRDKFLGLVTLANFPVDALRTRSSSDCQSFKISVTNLCCSLSSALPMAANATSRLAYQLGPNGFHQIVDFNMFQAYPTWYSKNTGPLNLEHLDFKYFWATICFQTAHPSSPSACSFQPRPNHRVPGACRRGTQGIYRVSNKGALDEEEGQPNR